MCLAVPARVEEIRGTQPEFLCGIVDFGGVRREVSLAFTPAAQPGDYVLVHAGFALEVVDEKRLPPGLPLSAPSVSTTRPPVNIWTSTATRPSHTPSPLNCAPPPAIPGP